MDNNGHLWIPGKDGQPDLTLADYENHSGPICILCGYSFCTYCHPKGAPDPCRITAPAPEPRTLELL